MQLGHKPDPTKASKATLTTETSICSNRSKLNHESMEPVQSQGEDSQGITRSSARRDYKSVETVSHQAHHGYYYDKVEKK